MLACSSQLMISGLLQSKKEASHLFLGCLVYCYQFLQLYNINSTKLSCCDVLGNTARSASVNLVHIFYHVQVSLYEDLVAAWVPAKHEWLKGRPLGGELVTALGKQKMFSYCACTLSGVKVTVS